MRAKYRQNGDPLCSDYGFPFERQPLVGPQPTRVYSVATAIHRAVPSLPSGLPKDSENDALADGDCCVQCSQCHQTVQGIEFCCTVPARSRENPWGKILEPGTIGANRAVRQCRTGAGDYF
uniref:Uncharacterized protein n=1 Tax=Anopheles maculatus TaxID=74869 RepID=A0A182SPI6_9DIPT